MPEARVVTNMSGPKCIVSPSTAAKLETLILLEQWGRWSRMETGVNLGFPKKAVHESRGSTVPSPIISDEVAMLVDKCVSAVENQRARDALVLRYCQRMSDRDIGRELKCHHKTVNTLLSIGEGEVQEMLL